jgi:hypothetical protein
MTGRDSQPHHPTTDQQGFRPADNLEVEYGRHNAQRIATRYSAGMVSIEECDLDVAQARELRDWLNEVLPP